jgi:hypothetical protein
MATIETRTTSSGFTRDRVKVRLPSSRQQSRIFTSLEATRTWNIDGRFRCQNEVSAQCAKSVPRALESPVISGISRILLI